MGTQTGYYHGGLGAVREIVAHESVRTLWRGLSIRLAYVVPTAAFNFTLYTEVKQSLLGDASAARGLGALAAGAAVRVTMTAIRTPFDVTRQSMQVAGMRTSTSDALGQRQGARDALNHAAKHGYFRGILPTIVRDISFGAVYFGSYEVLKWLEHAERGTGGDALRHGLAGAGAGAIGTLAAAPADVVKTRMQTASHLPAEALAAHPVSAVQTLRSIVRDEGAATLWRGCGPRMLQTIPASAITFTIYESVKKILEAQTPDRLA
mmetsp:Transcript_16470/g.51506  ORF Transcript_16470/g.51506 Transcript_16470/m.51506 type:complete len:264 (-) Transcript_16470:48-839(-)